MTTSYSTPAPSSPADALRVEEARRTRDVLRLGWVVAAGIAVAVVLSPGNPTLRNALLVVLALGTLGSFWMRAVLANPTAYSPARMNVLALAALAAGQLGMLYVGVFSAAPIMLALGMYFFCRTESVTSAIATYAITAGGHGIAAALIIGGVVDDPGFYRLDPSLGIEVQVTGQLLIQAAYGLCFWLARVSRTTSLRAIEQLQAATRLAAQRDVQLAELRRDLDRALEVGGPGRFTGAVVGRWELGVVLGRGSMGEVYAATNPAKPDEVAAVKLLRREMLTDARNVERFLREVRIASAIDSPHVVRVLEASSAADAIPFLAMEKLDGDTLATLLREGKTLAPAPLTAMVTAVGRVLDLARAQGIVHRDLKPQNVFLTRDGTWKVLDFGVALLADTSGTLTRGAAIGTPAYMPPEQARGDTVDHRADVYALGAVMYRCVTGRAPYGRADTPTVLYAVVHDMPVRPSSLANIAFPVEAVLQIALAKSANDRFQTAAELVDAFSAASRGSLSASLLERAASLPPWAELPASSP